MTAWQLVADVAIDGAVVVGTYPTREACLRAWREERRRVEDGDYGPEVAGFAVRELIDDRPADHPPVYQQENLL